MNVLNVSSLNEQIQILLESTFSRVLVEGELSRITFHNSGHIYFTLKDSTSTLKAVMFKGNATKLKFQLKEGLKVILDGAITLYKPRGEYQINCFSIEPAGHGTLALAYEQLKQKLASKGYFEQSIKKQLPKFPSKIALITSATGAALQDMLRVANSRYRALEIDIYDVLVQGDSAASSIANAIIVSDTREYDFIVIGRGGGSIEDLWAFNEEIVADAIFRAKTPIVSAVGHEIDWLISDFVSDLRVPTPSAAMQMCLPDSNELYQTLDSLSVQYTQIVSQKIQSSKQELTHMYSLYSSHSIQRKLEQKMQEVKILKDSFFHAMSTKLNVAQSQVLNLQKMIESNHPKFKSKKGFAQISQDSKVIDISTLNVGDDFLAQSAEVSISAKVIKKENIL
ncbi:exodeoxyribonuclease VII, large subunit [Sulfurimonas gotlandica GD1]|uniref:Exodeoxyribonuclease 7 large subunit n=1 Tax=Sulfurimonas gotlandica (strain DSM 19862 / JCM 16533 / GD1) TaxID=929558 RepID=B6BN18_SULGG|nr:exodeoxyribonuclease VII large subunit [Sulfurimonas gotlandica]EDZ61658.1 exodeoxyribonuclease VII, large subunit [Sulfurimonas gotlandica GD1]EHP30706.1 exodeoxyribonuclease VII, large subunit [Sulfurimonas gotlandica GD1]